MIYVRMKNKAVTVGIIREPGHEDSTLEYFNQDGANGKSEPFELGDTGAEITA